MRELIRHILHEELRKWTKEEVIDLAKNFKTMNQFKKAYPRAYGAARHNKWLDDVRELMTPAYEKWDEKKVKDIASKYTDLSTFAKEQSKALDAARHMGIYDEVTNHMSRQFHYWTKDEVMKIASKYKTRSEFITNDSNAYQAARHNGWYDDATKHMDRLGNLYQRLVYAYEFPNKSVYVGLTLSKERRNVAHFTKDNSAVFRYIKKTGLEPELKIISDEYILADDAVNLEICTIEKYRSEGWNILNIAKGGSLGACKRVWDKDTVIEIALKYTKMNDFKKNSPKAYQAARNYGWLDDIRVFLKPVYKTWTDDEFIKVMSKYNKINDFRKNEYDAFNHGVRKHGYQYIKDYFFNKVN